MLHVSKESTIGLTQVFFFFLHLILLDTLTAFLTRNPLLVQVFCKNVLKIITVNPLHLQYSTHCFRNAL